MRLLQADLPDTLTPYADIAAQSGLAEAKVLDLIRELRESGAIRRFGASIRHQKSGWNANVMVAWKVDNAQADIFGSLAAKHPRVSHCYFRPQKARDWPYTLYTMVHGRNTEECQRVVDELRTAGLHAEYAMLYSLKELKKTSMHYF